MNTITISIFIVLFLLIDIFILGVPRFQTLINANIIQNILLATLLIFSWPASIIENIFLLSWIIIMRTIIFPFLITRIIPNTNIRTISHIPLFTGPILARVLGIVTFLIILFLGKLIPSTPEMITPPVSLEIGFFTLAIAVFIFLTSPAFITQIIAINIFSNGLFLLGIFISLNFHTSLLFLIVLDFLILILTSIVIYFKIDVNNEELNQLPLSPRKEDV